VGHPFVILLRHRPKLPGDVGKLDVVVDHSVTAVDNPRRKHLPRRRALRGPRPQAQPHRARGGEGGREPLHTQPPYCIAFPHSFMAHHSREGGLDE
jgi:hypothetical protein